MTIAVHAVDLAAAVETVTNLPKRKLKNKRAILGWPFLFPLFQLRHNQLNSIINCSPMNH